MSTYTFSSRRNFGDARARWVSESYGQAAQGYYDHTGIEGAEASSMFDSRYGFIEFVGMGSALEGKTITEIKLTLTYSGGNSTQKTLHFWGCTLDDLPTPGSTEADVYCDSTQDLGTYYTTVGAYNNNSETIILNSTSNNKLFNYLSSGKEVLCIYNGETTRLSGKAYSANYVKIVDASVTVTYLEQYTVTYTDGTPATATKIENTDLIIQSTANSKTGHSFSTWNTNPDGSGTSYSNGSTYSTNANLVLYPVYTKNTYTVSYSSNGYTVSSGLPSSQTKTYGESLTLSTSIPIISDKEVTGYTVTFDANGGSCSTASLVAHRLESRTFKNWNSKSNGTGTSYAEGGSYTNNSPATLYLQTNDPTYTTQAITLPTATRSGYAHLGWAATSTATSGSTGNYTPAGSLTLYAIWEAQSLVYIDNGTSFDAYTIWIDNGSTWDQYAAYIDDGTKWVLCGVKSEEHIHNYKHTYIFEPTCTKDGYTAHVCSCGESYTDNYVDAVGHSWDEGIITTEPTDTETGIRTYTCTVCGETKTETIHETSQPHSYTSTVVEPTCSSEGYVLHTCSCGHSYTDQHVEPLEHNWVTYKAVEPTCTTEGNIAYQRCPDCGAARTCEENPVPLGLYGWILGPTSHSYGDWYTVTEPTCTEVGWRRRDCTVCDYYETFHIPAIGHTYESIVTAPTCTEQGYTTHTCTVCGDSYVDEYVDPEHSYISIVTTPTCTEQGYTTHTCSGCDDSYVDSYVAALGHSMKEILIEPTCIKWGCTLNVCEREGCGESEATNYVPALGHNYVDGVCSRCGVTEDHVHSYDAVVTAPTCTEQGYTTHTCSCGDSYVDSYVEATNHDYEATVIEPTCGSGGYTIHTCKVCGDKYTDDITYATLEHNYKSSVTSPTCTEKGYITYTCTTCGDNYVEDHEDALGHVEGDSITVMETESTCTERGWKEVVTYCSRCGQELKREYIHDENWQPELLHDWVESEGSTYVCAQCGARTDSI